VLRADLHHYATEHRRHLTPASDPGVPAAVKVGKDGAWIAEDSALHQISSVAMADGIDTNGAGDAWAAGFPYGYLRN